MRRITTIDGIQYKKMLINGKNNLSNNYQHINDLNVFPVPDGDTGTNMKMTIDSGLQDIINSDEHNIGEMSKLISKGLLMGARGNSGVILSQIFRGISIGFEGKTTVNAIELSEAFTQGVETSYKALLEPVEGTILTVSREASEHLAKNVKEDMTINEAFEVYLDAAKKSLDNTPNLLPILKDAGVVDSGGAGLIDVIQGMYEHLCGNKIEAEVQEEHYAQVNLEIDINDITFTYCTEFIVLLNDVNTKREVFVEHMESIGDSCVVVKDDNLLKVHVHTNEPEFALAFAHQYGEFKTLKIENMVEQYKEQLAHKEVPFSKPRTKFGLIAVCFGQGIKDTFSELGVHYIIDGGQTMNPPTEDFIKAIEAVNADNVIIIPNNSNVMLSALQAKDSVEGCKVEVLPAKTIPQGYSSLISFDANSELEDNIEEMTEAIKGVKTAEITYAVRDTEMNGVKIKKDDYMGIIDGKIEVSQDSKSGCLKSVLERVLADDPEIITVFCGSDVNEDGIVQLEELVASINEEVELETINGSQSIYSYLIAVE